MGVKVALIICGVRYGHWNIFFVNINITLSIIFYFFISSNLASNSLATAGNVRFGDSELQIKSDSSYD